MGASLKRVGTTVSCPRCKAELKVPGPDEQTSAGGAGAGEEARPTRDAANPLPQFMEEIAAAIPEDLAGLRPEDIRVEAGFADLVVTTPEPVPTFIPPPVAVEPAAPVVPPSTPVSAAPAPSPPEVEPEPSLPPAPAPIDAAQGSPLPPINIEPPRILPSGREFRTVQEVILQPATVLAWSLLVLMALPMAFIAGLMIGHFVWK